MMKQREGQTLVESLLAGTVIVIGVVALLSLLVNSRVVSDINSHEVIALQLANESLEAARYIRDSNWLKTESGSITDFSENLHDGTDYGAVYQWNPTSSNPDTAISFGFISGGGINSNEAIVYQHNGNGYYRQSTSSLISAFEETEFRRWITFYPICFYTDATPLREVLTADGQSCADAGRPYVEIGMHITAHVQWSSRGVTYDRILETELTNWKYADEDFSLNSY